MDLDVITITWTLHDNQFPLRPLISFSWSHKSRHPTSRRHFATSTFGYISSLFARSQHQHIPPFFLFKGCLVAVLGAVETDNVQKHIGRFYFLTSHAFTPAFSSVWAFLPVTLAHRSGCLFRSGSTPNFAHLLDTRVWLIYWRFLQIQPLRNYILLLSMALI